MAYYAIPKHNIVFNLNDFTNNEEEALTIFTANNRYIKRGGDSIYGSYFWFNTHVFKSTTQFQNNIKINDSTINIYDINNNVVGSFDNQGNIVCKKINNIDDSKFIFLENVTSDIQEQLNFNQSNITTINNTTIPNINQNILTNLNSINLIDNTTIPNINQNILTNLNSINLINNTSIPTINQNISTNLNSINLINNETIPASVVTSKNYTDTSISSLIANSPSTMDNLFEISQLLTANINSIADIIKAIDDQALLLQGNINLKSDTIYVNNQNSILQTDINTINSNISNVDNVSDLLKPISNLTQTALDTINFNVSNVDNVSDLSKPISNLTQIALNTINSNISNVNNVSDLLKPISNLTQTALNTINNNISNVDNVSDLLKPISNLTQTALNTINSNISNVDNVSDLLKPISNLTQTALNTINNNISNVNNVSDLSKPISNLTQTALNTINTNINNNYNMLNVVDITQQSLIDLNNSNRILDISNVQTQVTNNSGFITSLNSTTSNLQSQITSNDTDILNNYNAQQSLINLNNINRIIDINNRVLQTEYDTNKINVENQIESNDTDILNIQNSINSLPNNTALTGVTTLDKIKLLSDTVDKECLIYFDNTNDCSMINSIHHGITGKKLCLNTLYGGDIVIGLNSQLILGANKGIDFNNATITNFNKSDINLDLVTNESKTTMFSEPHFTGNTEIDELSIGNAIYQNGWVLPIIRARISFNSDGAVITPIYIINIGTRTYISKGYYRFFFDTGPFGIAPPNINYEVNCVGNYQGDTGYNGIMAYNISNLTINSFDIKQYRLGLSGSAENHDPGGFTSISVSW